MRKKMAINKNFVNRMISVVLSISMIVSILGGCGINNAPVYEVTNETSIDTSAIVEIINDEIQHAVEEQNATPVEISTNWEDYVGDLDTLVYGLIDSEYSLCYDVFHACVDLADGTTVYGLGYTDYSGIFYADNDQIFFPAGFISYIGEEGIPTDEIDEGLVVIDLDSEDDYGFILSYEVTPYLEHCVVWNQYLKYGVDEKGSITYEASDYVPGECDESLGSLYSYDEERYVYDINVGEYKYISGEELFCDIDFEELEAEVNRVLEEQDNNFVDVDIQTAIYIAQEAVNTFFLSRQEESFMGYKVEDLIALSAEIDPMECIRFTSDGMMIVDISLPENEGIDKVLEWVTGITCAVAVISCIALDILCPAMVPLSGAISSVAVEVFMEVVINNQTINNINWGKVGVSAVAGVLLAWCTPMIAAKAAGGVVKILGTTLSAEAIKTIGNIAGQAVLALSNGLVSGVTAATFKWIDGGDSAEIFDAFKVGTLVGTLLTAGISLVAAGVGTAAKAYINSHENGWFSNAVKEFGNWLTGYTDEAGNFVQGHQIHFDDDIEAILVPKSIHQAVEEAYFEVLKQACGGSEVLAQKIMQLPSDRNPNFHLYDSNGNPIKKNELAELGGDGILTLSDDCKPEIAEAWAEKGITEIKITNGDPQFGVCSDYSFTPSSGISSNRDVNMINYRKDLANDWTEHPELIPQNVKDKMLSLDIPLDSFTGDDLQEVFSALGLTLHEGTDGNVYLMSRVIHQSIGHYGGVALAKVMEKMVIASESLMDLIHTPAASIRGSLLVGGMP